MRIIALTLMCLSLVAAKAAAAQVSTPGSDDVVFYDAVAGNAFENLEDGDTGEVAVVAVGPIVQAADWPGIPIVIRNNTDDHITSIGVSGVLRDGGGSIIGAGQEQTVAPRLLAPGSIGLVTVGFDGIEAPPNATIEFTIDARPLQDVASRPFRDLDVLEVTRVEDRLVGLFTNSYQEPIEGPFAISAMCFDDTGELQSAAFGDTGVDLAEPGEDIPFQVDLSGDLADSCTTYLVAAFGYPAG